MKTNIANTRGFTLVEIMIVVTIIGVLAAIAIPGLKHSIDRARAQSCAANRKNIDGAKVQWAAEHRRPLTDVPTDTDLFGQNAYIDHKPDCPGGGTYSLNSVEDKCACTAAKHGN